MPAAEAHQPIHVDVAVIGAGLSGLVAAHTVLRAKPDARVVVLEANNRVGGRILTDAEGTELGAAFLGPSQHRMMVTVHDLGLSLYSVDTEGPQVLEFNGKRRVFSGAVPDHNWFVRLDVNHAMRVIDRDVALVSTAKPHTTPDAKRLDHMSLEQYLRQICWTDDAYWYLLLQLSTVQTTNASQLSALECLWFVKQTGNLPQMLAGETWKTKGGNNQIVEKLAASLPAGAVRLQHAVSRVQYDRDDVVVLKGVDVPPVHAKRVIFAIPPVQIARVDFHPSLPSVHAEELAQYPMGRVIKTFTYYSTRCWKPLNGRVLCAGDNTVANDIFDDSHPDHPEGVILGFIGNDDAGRFGRLSPEERSRLLAAQYARCLECPAMLEPIKYKEKTMSSEKWIGGCYYGVPRGAALSTYGRRWRRPMAAGRIFFAGTEAADSWLGYMEGAHLAGEVAAREALTSLQVPLPPMRDYDAESRRIAKEAGLHVEPLPASWASPLLPSPAQALLGLAVVAAAVTAVAVRCAVTARAATK